MTKQQQKCPYCDSENFEVTGKTFNNRKTPVGMGTNQVNQTTESITTQAKCNSCKKQFSFTTKV